MNTAGLAILGVCAVGGVIACVAFIWAMRSGEFTRSDDARWLVFDDEDEVKRPEAPRPGPKA
jgi:cbb3-type cytochrome oxidase maturation protein